MMIITIVLCICNVVIHFRETREEHRNDGIYNSNSGIWVLTLKEYWGSILIAIYTVLFGVFVFALCVFHSYITSKNLTTYEKLKHVYDRFPQSPFAFPSCTTNWVRTVFCVRRNKTKLSYMLYLKSNDNERFKAIRA